MFNGLIIECKGTTQEICLYLFFFFRIEFEKLLLGEAIGDGYMAVAIGVNARHLAAEEPAVGGGVAKLIDRDIIMDHLMENGVLDEVFGEVDARVDAEDEVLVAKRSKEPRAATGKGHFAEESARVRELDRDRRQRRSKETDVELIKAGLYVRDGGGQ